ncbi:hypothetical protein [Agarivorans gilvus]|uniref:hypothetical protein n=1 Tax=Agarivorans gilvus TaxID=680279 RepID=UPI000A4947C5|nr:hypothetical protein [Agarivorans gilvus]
MERCGRCLQFTRTRENAKDLCGAWEQPTSADRQACQFYIAKRPASRSKAAPSGA